MNAISLYVTISRLVFQNDPNDKNYKELFRLVPYLRHTFLSCSVCGNLLVEPFTPIDLQCQHHVCKLCLGGRKNLKPFCKWCSNYEKYEENIQHRIVLQCYKSLCEHISTLPFYLNLRRNNNNVNAVNSLIELIQEGVRFQDDFTRNSGLTKAAYSMLPCLYTNSSTQTINNLPNHKNVEEQTKKETPPAAIKTVSNGSSLYIVAHSGTGNKITIKRKHDNSVMPDEPTKKFNNILPVTTNFKKPTAASIKNLEKRKGCRCGNATATPGKLTCCGQRCPCYVESKSCIDCKCRGCRNPHRPDGFKVRPHIPELQHIFQNNEIPTADNCIEIPMETYTNSNSQEIENNQLMNTHSILDSDSMVFSTADLNSGNFQVVSVYTTQFPEMNTIPTFIMTNTPISSDSISQPPPLRSFGQDTTMHPIYVNSNHNYIQSTFVEGGSESDVDV